MDLDVERRDEDTTFRRSHPSLDSHELISAQAIFFFAEVPAVPGVTVIVIRATPTAGMLDVCSAKASIRLTSISHPCRG